MIGQLKSGEKYDFLMSEVCNSLHFASVILEDQLVPGIKIVSRFGR